MTPEFQLQPPQPAPPPTEMIQQKHTGNRTALAAMAGLAAPLVFTMLVILQGVLQHDYSHMALPVSALAAWPIGWLQTLNFVVFGLLVIAFAVGLHHGIVAVRNGLLGPALLVLSGVGILMAATFPWQRVGGEFVVPAGHLAGAVLTFVGGGAGLVAISRRMAKDPWWRRVARYTLVCGVLMVLLLILTMGFARAEDAPLNPWAGLLQRLFLAVWFPCMIVLAYRLWRVSRVREHASADDEVHPVASVTPPPSA